MWLLQLHLLVGNKTGYQDEIKWSAPHDPVGHVDIAALCVSGIWNARHGPPHLGHSAASELCQAQSLIATAINMRSGSATLRPFQQVRFMSANGSRGEAICSK